MASRARNIDQFETVQWMVVRFIIDEGPRYKIAQRLGGRNTKYTSEDLMADLKLKRGDYLIQARTSADVISIQDNTATWAMCSPTSRPTRVSLTSRAPSTWSTKSRKATATGWENGRGHRGRIPPHRNHPRHQPLVAAPRRHRRHPRIRASRAPLRASQLFEANPANGSRQKSSTARRIKKTTKKGQSHANGPQAAIAQIPQPKPGHAHRRLRTLPATGTNPR